MSHSVTSPLNRLIVRAQRGEDAAFAEIVRRYQDAAVAYAAAILRDHDLAHDGAQEGFIEAFRALPALRDPDAFPAWLRKIVFKHCDRMTRHAEAGTVPLDKAIHGRSPEPTPERAAQASETSRQVLAAINRLPEGEAAVTTLFYLREYSGAEIAAFLGITPNTVKTRLYSARKRLRKELIPMLEEDLDRNRPSKGGGFVQRVLSSLFPIQVSSLDEWGDRRPVGSTVGGRTADIPDASVWIVEPRALLGDQEWDALIDQIRDLQIPGIAAGGQMTDALLRRIAQLDHITYLDLSGSGGLSAEGVQALSGLPRLEHLDLSCPYLSDDALRVLRRLPCLKSLAIYHQPWLSDAGMGHLSESKDLERVSLIGTRTGDPTIATLSGKPDLASISPGSHITDEGLRLLSQYPAYQTPEPGDLNLSLLEDTPGRNRIWLNLKAPISDAGLAHLSGLPGLRALTLFATTGHAAFDDSGSRVTPEGLGILTTLPNLNRLGCTARLCNDLAMQQIAQIPQLRFLDCQDTVAGDDGFRSLSASQSIEYIWGRRCHNLTGTGFAALSGMPALKGLSVSCKNVDDAGLAALPRFPALRELMPMDVPDAGFHHIAQCPTLETLYLMYCHDTTDVATNHIAGLRLKSYQAWAVQITDRSLEILSQMDSLAHIRLSRCAAITDTGLASLGRLPNLRAIDLEQLKGVTQAGANVFAPDVRVNYEAGTDD